MPSRSRGKTSQSVPKSARFAMGEINRRIRGSRMIYENRDELAAELLSLGTSVTGGEACSDFANAAWQCD